MIQRLRRFGALGALTAALMLAACGGGGNEEAAVTPPVAAPPQHGPVARVELLPAGGMLVDTSERRTLTVKAFDAAGIEVPVPAADLRLVSSDPTGIEVSRAGNGFEVRATAMRRSSLLTASVGTVSAQPAVFFAAAPVAGAVAVADAQVRSEPAPVDADASRGLGFRYRVTLSDVPGLTAGAIVVGTGTQPVGGRVVSSSANPANPAHTDVVLELVPLGALFDNLAIDLEFSVEQMKQLMQLEPGVKRPASAGNKTIRSVGGASCEGDAPALAAISGELEARIDPRLRSEFVLDIGGGVVRKARVAAFGGLDVAGKAVINLGAAVSGGVTCKATLGFIPIPITGVLSPLIAPIVPLNAKFDLGALVQVNLFTFSAEIKQSAEFDFGFDYDIARSTGDAMQAIKRLQLSDPEFTRNLSFPTAASLRVKTTAFVGLTSGLALGGVLARLELVEIFAGPEFEAKFGGSYDVATDAVYTSEYELKAKAGVGPGDDVAAALTRIFGSSKAIDLTLKTETSIAKTPGATAVSTEKSSFAAGEPVRFDVELAASSVNFPLVGYNVKEVRIYRLRHGNTTSAEPVAVAAAADGQTRFQLDWTADAAGEVRDPISGKPNFYAFVVDKPLALVSGFFPFELGAVSARDVGAQGLIAGGGTHSLAIDGAGRVVSWGSNHGGALGRQNPSSLPNFVEGIPTQFTAKAVAAGGWHSLALLSSGQVYAWGFGPDVGPATGGGTADVLTARRVNVPGIAIAIASRYRGSLVLLSSGEVYGFGRSPSSPSGSIVRIGIDRVKAIADGERHGLALRDDGTVWAWGVDTHGQLGGGGDSLIPVKVPGLPPIKAIAASSYTSFALDETGRVWSWGHSLVLGRPGDTTPARIEGLSGVKAISAGNYTAFALMDDATVKAWGDNWYGRVGVYRGDDIAPATIPGLNDVVEVNGAEFHGMALTRSGAVYAWGRNEGKALNGGDSPPDYSQSPILSGFFR